MRESGRRGESNYNGRDVIRGPSFGGMGHRMLIVGPLATAAVIDKDINNNDNDDNNDRRCGGGVSCPPPLRSTLSLWTPLVVVPSCRTLLVIVNVANRR